MSQFGYQEQTGTSCFRVLGHQSTFCHGGRLHLQVQIISRISAEIYLGFILPSLQVTQTSNLDFQWDKSQVKDKFSLCFLVGNCPSIIKPFFQTSQKRGWC